jgi:ketol-acid reductoisomerase
MHEKKQVVIIGYGSQAKAWARNLRDSGWRVNIALRPESLSIDLVKTDEFTYINISSHEISKETLFVVLTPDDSHLDILTKLKGLAPEDSIFLYAHGYSCTQHSFFESFPHWNHILLAPKAIASEVRFQYETKGKLGAVLSLEGIKEHPSLKEIEITVRTLATDLGITAGPYIGSFKDETYADLFSEQTLLCSLLPYGALHSYNALREKGISKEIAYLECWMEVKLIADTMVKLGPQKFFDLISPNALIGGEKAQKLIFDKVYQETLKKLLDDIWSEKFFEEVDQTNIQELKSRVNKFWSKEELSQTHEDMGPELFT